MHLSQSPYHFFQSSTPPPHPYIVFLLTPSMPSRTLRALPPSLDKTPSPMVPGSSPYLLCSFTTQLLAFIHTIIHYDFYQFVLIMCFSFSPSFVLCLWGQFGRGKRSINEQYYYQYYYYYYYYYYYIIIIIKLLFCIQSAVLYRPVLRQYLIPY